MDVKNTRRLDNYVTYFLPASHLFSFLFPVNYFVNYLLNAAENPKYPNPMDRAIRTNHFFLNGPVINGCHFLFLVSYVLLLFFSFFFLSSSFSFLI